MSLFCIQTKQNKGTKTVGEKQVNHYTWVNVGSDYADLQRANRDVEDMIRKGTISAYDVRVVQIMSTFSATVNVKCDDVK